MPLLLDKTVFLHFCHVIVEEFAHNAVVEDDGVTSISIVPLEGFLDLAVWAETARGSHIWRRWRWMQPALVLFEKWVEEENYLEVPIFHYQCQIISD